MLAARIATHCWYHRTVQDLFAETCSNRPGMTAIVFEGREISYEQLLHDVNRLSRALLDLGVGKGDVVSTLPSPTPEFACLYFAVLQVGGIINPLNLLWGTLEFEGVLPRNNPRLIVTVDDHGGRDYVALLKTSISDLQFTNGRVSSKQVPALEHLVCVSRTGKRHQGFIDFGELLEAGRTYDRAEMSDLVASAKPTDIQFICQTSGTTGLSKSALWDHRPPLATVNFAAKSLRYTDDERYINLSPFYHNSGLFALNLNLALAGSTLFLMEDFDPRLALEIVDRHKITSTFGFDAHWQGMRRVPDFDRYEFTIDKAVLAGEPRSYDLVRSMCPDEATINNLYAQTENGPLVSFADHDCVDYAINKYTHGRPLPGVLVVIKDYETGERVQQGKAGEICYKSPFMFRGYHRQQPETDASFDSEGYFHSGDYGDFDNGYITFLGRLGGVVKSGGENVSTTRVSALLLEFFGDEFEDVKTVGIDDAYWGARVVSFVRMRDKRVLRSTSAIREVCKGAMAAYEIPRDFLAWTDEWPVTAEGKVDFRRLQVEAKARLTKS